MPELTWSVAWEVATPPVELLPAQPIPPTPPGDDADEAAAQQYSDDYAAYEVALDQAYHQTQTVLADDQWWSTTRLEFADEAEARATLPAMVRANASSPYARNFRLETSPPRVWSTVS
uniref:Minor tail protein n=1 Tax=Mycobacterium phage BobbyK TaxID=3158892 RepID=A0AAU8GQH1_9CAUD